MKKNINLLPVELRKKSNVKRQKDLLTALIGLIIGIVLIGFFSFFGWIKFLEYRLAHVEEEMKTVMPKEVLEKRYNEENIQMEAEIKNLEKIQKEKTDWAVILQDMNNRLPSDMWITGFTYGKDEQIVISGLTANVADVGAFIYEMNQSKYTSDLSLKWVNEVKTGNIILNEFALTGTLAKGSE
ncbi:MAG: PilN domain-containing protein [Dehalobacterium sp.]